LGSVDLDALLGQRTVVFDGLRADAAKTRSSVGSSIPVILHLSTPRGPPFALKAGSLGFSSLFSVEVIEADELIEAEHCRQNFIFVFVCAGYEQPVFKSETKFENGTGWPSFCRPIEGMVDTKLDRSFLMERMGMHCPRCGGHLGHVFEDGPPPTGQSYCINGFALKFWLRVLGMTTKFALGRL
jgi:methionine-R-sulfoxide reductase